MARRSSPEINAGSMADIAFLLLIFFLVTTTIESDKGITRKLPPIEDESEPAESIHKERNVFEVVLSRGGELLVKDKPMDIEDLREAAIDFIDNGGGTGSAACTYCQGPQADDLSENPKKAIIALEYDRQTKYGKYIAVQNELMGAFNHLRDRVSQSEFGVPFSELQEELNKASNDVQKEEVKQKIDQIRKLYPLNISEAKPERVN